MNYLSLFAKVISYIFHPVLLPFYTLLMMLEPHSFFQGLIPGRDIIILLGSVLLSTAVFPLLMIYFLFRTGFVSSYFMQKKEERLFPLIAIAVFYYLTYYFLKGISISVLFSFFMLGSTLLVILALFLNFFFKISLHMVAIGGMTGFWTGLNIRQGTTHEIFLALLIFLGGLMGYARLQNGQHAPNEIYSGWLMGTGIMFALMMI
jgi:hypothetical protein